MADNVQPIVLDILVKIQAELGLLRSDVGSLKLNMNSLHGEFAQLHKDVVELRGEVAQLRSDVLPRLERVEGLLLKQRRSTAGILVSMNAVTGDFDGRVGRLERRVTVLEAHSPA